MDTHENNDKTIVKGTEHPRSQRKSFFGVNDWKTFLKEIVSWRSVFLNNESTLFGDDEVQLNDRPDERAKRIQDSLSSYYVLHFFYLNGQNSKEASEGFVELPEWYGIGSHLASLIYNQEEGERIIAICREMHEEVDRLKDLLSFDLLSLLRSILEDGTGKISQEEINEAIGKSFQLIQIAIFWAKKYLESYRKLIEIVVCCNLYSNELINDDVTRMALVSGYLDKSKTEGRGETNKEENNHYFLYRFFSPVYVENYIVVGQMIAELVDQWNHSDDKKNEQMLELTAEFLNESIANYFYLKTIKHGRVHITAMEDDDCYPSCCRIDHKSHVENIEPFRLIEKISAYITEYKTKIEAPENKNKKIRILIVNSVDLDENSPRGLSCLHKYLAGQYPEYQFEYGVYYNAKDEKCNKYNEYNKSKNWISIDANAVQLEYKELKLGNCPVILYRDSSPDQRPYLNPRALQYFLGKFDSEVRSDVEGAHDVIFILDCPALYKTDVVPKSDYPLDQFKDWIKTRAVNFPYESIEKKISLIPPTNLPIRRMVRQFNMFGLGVMDYEGHFEYAIKEDLIDELRKVTTTEKHRRIHVHVMLSASHSAENTRAVKWNVAREEQFRGKSFRLFTFKSKPNMSFEFYSDKHEQGPQKDFIWFTFWNLYKHINYEWLDDVNVSAEETSQLYRMLSLKDSQLGSHDLIRATKQIFICLTSKYDHSKQTAHYTVNWHDRGGAISTDCRSDFTSYLEQLFIKILNLRNGSFRCCYKNALKDTLYSRMRYWEDAIHYQLLELHYEQDYRTTFEVSYVESLTAENEKEIEDVCEIPSTLLPDRWIVVRTLKRLSGYLPDIEYYYLLHLMDEVKKVDEQFRKLRLFDQIYTACKLCGCEALELYENAKNSAIKNR